MKSKMPDYKNFESVDIYIAGDTTPEETKAFSKFLKEYKARKTHTKKKSVAPHRSQKQKHTSSK